METQSIYKKTLDYILNVAALWPSSAEVYYIYMKNKQHDTTMDIEEFMTLISRNFFYEKSMSIQFYA